MYREKKYFTAEPESMMIKVEHAVLATKFLRQQGGNDLAASQRNMKGYLYRHDGTTVRRQSRFYCLHFINCFLSVVIIYLVICSLCYSLTRPTFCCFNSHRWTFTKYFLFIFCKLVRLILIDNFFFVTISKYYLTKKNN